MLLTLRASCETYADAHWFLDQVDGACRPVPAQTGGGRVMIRGVTREDGYLLDNQYP
jgi:hypothetical protein